VASQTLLINSVPRISFLEIYNLENMAYVKGKSKRKKSQKNWTLSN